MYIFEHQLRVRYAETDQMGYVYYGNYAAYYEVARTEMLRAIGFSYKELEKMGVMMPVIDMQVKYHQPAKYDDLLLIKVSIREKPGVRIKFDYELFDERGTHLNSGYTELVFIDMQKNRPCRPPKVFMNKVEPYFLK